MIWLLLDDEAVDVSRVTGIPWSWERVETRGARRPCIEVSRLDWWDQIRVALTLVAGYYLTGG